MCHPEVPSPLAYWMRVSGFLCVASVLALTALQLVMPDKPMSSWGLNPAGATHLLKRLIGRDLPRLEPATFILCFRLLLGVAWLGYAVMVVTGLRGGSLQPGLVLALIVFLALVLALLGPPTLSSDTYAYAGYARMQALFDLNPYVHTPSDLRDRGDPVAEQMPWEMACIYGPIWLAVSVGVVRVLSSAGLWWQVTAFKLLAGAALVGTALAGRALARHHDPRRADLTLAAIGLNPLFLIEGPLSGHNDMLMSCLILMGALLFLRQQVLAGAFLLGLATGVKLISIVLVPWLMLVAGRRHPAWSGLIRALLVALLALAPTVVCYLPWWEGMRTFAVQRTRLDFAAPAPDDPLLSALTRMIGEHWRIVVIYLVLSFGLLRRGWETAWPTAWALLAVAMILLLMGIPYPWYLLWPLSISLTRWDRPRLALSAVCTGLAIVWTMGYTAIWM